MPCQPRPAACPWHRSPSARALFRQLGSADVRLVRATGFSDSLAWHPNGQAGAAIFAALSRLREAATGPAFAQARDDHTRAAALARAQQAPTVESAIAERFGDPDRWRGYEPLDATRRFRANCQTLARFTKTPAPAPARPPQP